MSTKIKLNSPEAIVANKEVLLPLVQDLPTAIRSRLGSKAIWLTSEGNEDIFKHLGIKIWHVVAHEDGRYSVKFQLSGSVVNGVTQPNPGKGGSFNFSIGGWTSVSAEDGWFNASESELKALEAYADWCSSPSNMRSEKPPAMWWSLSEATELVLVPILEKDVQCYVKDTNGKKVPTGAIDTKGQPVFATELRNFLSWSFMFVDVQLSGAGIAGDSLSRDDLAGIDPKATLCLI